MKKYFLSLTTIISAVVFSAFTKPFAIIAFKLLNNPTSDYIVSNPAQWSTSGTTFGDCTVAQNDLACTILLNSTKSSYYHEDENENVILNTFDFANAQSTKQDYMVIGETIGLNPDRIITFVTAYHWDAHANGPTGAYVIASLGSDLTFTNAKD